MRESLSDKVRRRLGMAASEVALLGPDKLAYQLHLKQSSGLVLPNFLGIGAQKAGTSWLWANLRQHPDLYLPERKELHYFNLYFYQSLASYAVRFEAGHDKLRGEVTPAYSILPPYKIAFIRRIMPGVKLILILRNPIDRAWSRARMMLRQAGDAEIDLNSLSDREIMTAITHRSSRARGDYSTIISNWLNCFPPTQLHIGFYEDLAREPKKFLEDIFTFLGASTDIDWDGLPYQTVIGHTGKTEIPARYRRVLEELYADKIEGLYRQFGTRVEGWRVPYRPSKRTAFGS